LEIDGVDFRPEATTNVHHGILEKSFG